MSSRLLYKYDCYQFSYRFTLIDFMKKVIGHFNTTANMWMYKDKHHCSFSQLAVLLTCVLVFNGLVLPVCQAQSNQGTNDPSAPTLQGICNPEQIPDPCHIGDKYGDPGDCTVYYECTSISNTLAMHTCQTEYKYDYKKKKCRPDRPDLKRAIRCQPPCNDEGNNNKKNRQGNNKVDTVVSTEKISLTSKETQSITEVNEALTTEEDKTGVKAAGNFAQDNDTFVPAMVDPNQGVPPAAAANTTAGETDEKTQAQTDKDDVVTTASSSTTSPTTPTTPTTPSTTSKSTTRSTTKSTTTTQPGVVVVETDGDPVYDIVTSPPGNSSGSVGGVDESKGVSTAHIGIAVGIIVALLIVSVAVILVICHVRKKKFTKEKQIVSIENPKYKSNGDKHAYRFSRDASLLVNEKPPNNNSSAEKLAFIPGRKRQAPSASKEKSKDKRKAPPPPNPFTGEVDDDFRPPTFRKDSADLYERDTDGSDNDVELSTFTAPTSSFGTGTGTFGKAKSFDPRAKYTTPNGRLRQQQSRSTDYSSEEENNSDEEDNNLLGRKYQSGDIDDGVFKDDVTAKDVNNSMDAYLSAYDQALK